MKNVFTILLLIHCINFCKAQTATNHTLNDTITNIAATELKTYAKKSNTGFALNVVGGCIATAGIIIKDNRGNINTPFLVVGGVVGVIGTYIKVSANRHIKNAGNALEALAGFYNKKPIRNKK